MKDQFHITPIGAVQIKQGGFYIQLEEQYIPALAQLEDFSHLQIIWWAHLADNPQARKSLVAEKLFKRGPEKPGIFATRAPARPNPIMSSTIAVKKVAAAEGRIETPFIDAEDGTPVLDIKPYYPMERVKNVTVPDWCRHWPRWQEEAASFNWQDEINFG